MISLTVLTIFVFCTVLLGIWRPGPATAASYPSPFAIDLYENCLRLSGVNTAELVTRPDSSVGVGSSAGITNYTDLNHQWNNCCGYKAPVAYFVVGSASDVQIGVRCARVARLRIVPKSGGHSYGKYSFGNNETVIIDLRNLDQIKVDAKTGVTSPPATVTIGPGALMGQITYGLQQAGGYTIPFGACQVVGMAYGLGGGFSEISRLYGMNVDAMLEVQIVNARGDLLVANAQQNPDLFWALRGGGGGSYGIVTQFKYRLFPAPKVVVQGRQLYAFTEFVSVFEAWQAMLRANPPSNVNAIIRLLPLAANAIELTVNQFQLTPGGNTSEVRRLLEGFPNTTLGPATVRTLSYLDFVVEAGNEETGYNINITDPSQLPLLGRDDFNPSGSLYAKTYYAPQYINNASDLQRMYAKLAARPDNILLVFRALGGAIATVAPTATAFVHRGQNLYEVDVLYIGPKGDAATASKRWMYEYYDLAKELVQHRESFQNHLDVELVDYLQRYYGENLPRLIQVKDVYDPENFYYNPQSIPTSRLYNSGTGVYWNLF